MQKAERVRNTEEAWRKLKEAAATTGNPRANNSMFVLIEGTQWKVNVKRHKFLNTFNF